MTDTILIPKDTPDWQSLLSDVQASVSDAENYALATSQFTDTSGKTFDKGARGYRNEVSNIIFRDLDPNPIWGFQEQDGKKSFRQLKGAVIEIKDPHDKEWKEIAKLSDVYTYADTTTNSTIWGVQAQDGRKVFRHNRNGVVEAYDYDNHDYKKLSRRRKNRDLVFSTPNQQDNFPRAFVEPFGNIITYFTKNMDAHVAPGEGFILKHDLTGNKINSYTIKKSGWYYEAAGHAVLDYNNIIILFQVVNRQGTQTQSDDIQEPAELYKSTDQGESWSKFSSLPSTGGDEIRPTFLKYDRQSGFLYTAGRPDNTDLIRIFKSTDGGSTWSKLKDVTSPTNVTNEVALEVLGYDSNGNPQDLYLVIRTADKGIDFWYSQDEGSSWSSAGIINVLGDVATRPKLYKNGGTLTLFYGVRGYNFSTDIAMFRSMDASISEIRSNPSLLSVWQNKKTLHKLMDNTNDTAYGDIVNTAIGKRIVYYDNDPNKTGNQIYIVDSNH